MKVKECWFIAYTLGASALFQDELWVGRAYLSKYGGGYLKILTDEEGQKLWEARNVKRSC